jgi:hypothetical protein
MGMGDPDEPESGRLHRLEQEIAGLRRAMISRAVIEQAKGILAERLGCDPQTAFNALTRWSQTRNVPVARLAADLVAAGSPPTDPTGELAMVQKLVGFGWAAWPPADRLGHWSEGLQRLVGRSEPHPPALEGWPELFLAVDQPAARALARQWSDGQAASGELRVRPAWKAPPANGPAASDEPPARASEGTQSTDGPAASDEPPTRQSGGIRVLRVSGVPGEPADGWSLLVVAQDVTELWEATQRVRRAESAVAVNRLLLAGRGPAGRSAVVGHGQPESGESVVQQA